MPEFYETAGELRGEDVVALLQSGKLGAGACLTTTMTVDDTAPEVTALSKDLRTGNLTVPARDNQYIAVVQVLPSAGTEVLASSAMVETEAGGLGSVTLDLSQLKLGPTCMVRVADYAGNETLYTVEYGGRQRTTPAECMDSPLRRSIGAAVCAGWRSIRPESATKARPSMTAPPTWTP